MKILLDLLVRTLAVLITAYLIPGVVIDNLITAVTAVIVLGLLNILIKPVIIILTLPVNILTLGLFTFIINALIVVLASWLINGFTINSFWSGMLFSIVLSLVNWFLNSLKS